MAQATSIRPARASDLSYLLALNNKLNHELGFIPWIAFERRISGEASGGIIVARENADRAGYLHFGSLAMPVARIFQAAIQYDAQRRHHGEALVNDFEHRARVAGAAMISLTCRTDLEANKFWRAMGFRKIETIPCMRGEKIHWIKRLSDRQIVIPRRSHACPVCKATTGITIGPKGQIYKTCRLCTAERLIEQAGHARVRAEA